MKQRELHSKPEHIERTDGFVSHKSRDAAGPEKELKTDHLSKNPVGDGIATPPAGNSFKGTYVRESAETGIVRESVDNENYVRPERENPGEHGREAAQQEERAMADRSRREKEDRDRAERERLEEERVRVELDRRRKEEKAREEERFQEKRAKAQQEYREGEQRDGRTRVDPPKSEFSGGTSSESARSAFASFENETQSTASAPYKDAERRDKSFEEKTFSRNEREAFSESRNNHSKTNINGTTGQSNTGATSSTRASNSSFSVHRGSGSSRSRSADMVMTQERFKYAKAVAIEGERFAKSVTGAITSTVKDVARSEETGTVRQIDNFNDARKIVINSLKAAKDAPRQIGNTVKVGANVVTAVGNAGRSLVGQEAKEYRRLKTQKALALEEKSKLTNTDRQQLDNSLGRSEKKYAKRGDTRVSRDLTNLHAEKAVLEGKLNNSGLSASSRELIEGDIRTKQRKIEALERVQEVRAKASGEYGDAAKVGKVSKMERIQKRTEKKIKKAQYAAVGGRKNYRAAVRSETSKQKVAELDRQLGVTKSKLDSLQEDRVRLSGDIRKKKYIAGKEIGKLRSKKHLTPDERRRLRLLKAERKQLKKSDEKFSAGAKSKRSYYAGRDMDQNLGKKQKQTLEAKHLKGDMANIAKESGSLNTRFNRAKNQVAGLQSRRDKKAVIANAPHLPIPSRDSLLSTADKGRLAILSEKIARNKAMKKMRTAKGARKELGRTVTSAMSKASEHSEENAVQGVAKASRFVQNKYAREVMKCAVKPAVSLTKFVGKKTVVPLAKKAEAKLAPARAQAKEAIIHSKPVSKVRNVANEQNIRVRNLAKKTIETAQKKVSSMRIVEVAKNGVRNVAGTAQKLAEKAVPKKVKTFAGKTKSAAQILAKKLNPAGKAVKKGAGFVKKIAEKVIDFKKMVSAIATKAVLIAGCFLLLVGIAGAALAAIGGAAEGAPSLGGSSSKYDFDLEPVLKDHMQPIHSEWEKEVNDVIAYNSTQYDQVFTVMADSADGTEKEYFLRIMMMAAMSADVDSADLDSAAEQANLHQACKHLFREAYSYEVVPGEYYSCTQGCATTITYCEGCLTPMALVGDASAVQKCDGHEVTYCPGSHRDAFIKIQALPVEQLYLTENQNLVSANSGLDSGMKYSKEFFGWTEESVQLLEEILAEADDIYEGVDLLDDLVLFTDVRAKRQD